MFIALLESQRGRKDRESEGFAAKTEVRPRREEGGEKRGFGRKCSRVWSGRRSPERAARELTAVPGGSGCPALQLLRQLPHLVPGRTVCPEAVGRGAPGPGGTSRPRTAAPAAFGACSQGQDPAPGTAFAMPSGMGTSSPCIPMGRGARRCLGGYMA